jgi:glycosyltransferase involved in cell wall biosynthesis
MRLLFVVQRYGTEVAGGAEAACREMASRLAGRGHQVDALTSCAQSYVDWANFYPEGTEILDGVTVHRLAVAKARQDRFFGPMNARAVHGHKPVPLYLQTEWMRMQGPDLPGLVPWLTQRAASYDVVVFFTYLYYTTWAGLPVAAGLAPTVLHPTAHDEPPLWLPLFDWTFRQPTAFGFLTEEEEALVNRRFHAVRPRTVVGLGVDLEATGDETAFRARYGIGDRPYVVYVGRLDPGKGSDELYGYFTAYKARNPGPLALVVVGEPVKPFAPHPDVICTGFVDEATKTAAMVGSMCLIQPSYYESFSLVLAESWVQSKPALVQGHCDVLVGQAQRSQGAIPYVGYAQFEAALDLLRSEATLGSELGARGRRYVERRYSWDTVLDLEEHLLAAAQRMFRQSSPPAPRPAVSQPSA